MLSARRRALAERTFTVVPLSATVEQSNALQKRTVAADPSSPFGSAKPHVPAETTRTDRQYLEEMMKAQVGLQRQ